MADTLVWPLGGSSPFVHEGVTYSVPCYTGNGSTTLNLEVDANFQCQYPYIFNKY
jgi:hypothetical protein